LGEALAKNSTQKGTEFEIQIAALYRSAGYDITQNFSVSGSDFDLLCQKEILPQVVVAIVVECKFKSGHKKVGPLDIEKFSNKFKYAKDHGITHGIVICNNGFTPSAHVTAAQCGNISLRSYAELEDDLLGFAAKFIAAQRKYRSSDVFREYFRLEGSSDNSKKLADIERFIFDALNEAPASSLGKRFFLLGDFGAGKTTLVDRLNYNLQDQYLKDRTKKIPIVFRLNRLLVENDLRRFIENQLKSELGLDLNSETFITLMNSGKITLFLDGLDEIESHADEQAKIFNIARISPFFNSKCDLIVSSRPTMFRSQRQLDTFFAYIEQQNTITSIFNNTHLTRSHLQLAMERLRALVAKHAGQSLKAENLANSELISIQPLSKEVVISVLNSKKSILEQSQSMAIDDIIRELFNIYDLSDLMSRPFLLFMVIDVLTVHKIKEMIDQNTISSAMLYNIYIESYLRRDWDKGKGRQFLTAVERRTFSQSMALSMLYKGGRLSVTLSEVFLVLKRVMNERMPIGRKQEIDSNIQSVVSDILLCAFLRLSGEDMFEFVHKSFMEYFSAEYIATVLVDSPPTAVIGELQYDLNQEILQFIGGLSTAFKNLIGRLISQLSFTLPSGPNVYRKNLAASLLYSNRDGGIELTDVTIADCSFRRKSMKYSSFNSVTFDNCSFSDIFFADFTVRNLKLKNCRLLASKIIGFSGNFDLSDVTCEKVALSRSEDSTWTNTQFSEEKELINFSNGEISNCKIRLDNRVSIAQSKIVDATLSFSNRNSLRNKIAETEIVNSKLIQLGETVSFGREISLIKNSQVNLVNCSLEHITFAYPVISLDLLSFNKLNMSSGVFLTSAFEIDKDLRNSNIWKRAGATVNPALSPYFGLHIEKNNQILIVNLDSDESLHLLRRLIEFTGTIDPAVVVRVLTNNKDWLPQK
jgi:hypothetical protein